MKRTTILALSGLALLTAFPALATCKKPALQFFGDDTGVITWQSLRVDSPLDGNSGRLALHVLQQSGNDYVGAYNDCTGIKNKLAPTVRNLSFDFQDLTGNPAVHVGAGAPRYSVLIDSDGDLVEDTTAFLAALYCQEPLADGWSRADWTGRTAAGCTLFIGTETFTSDGVSSAWTLLAQAHPNHRVIDAFLVMDEEGTSFVDRLAIQNKMFIQSGSTTAAVKTCASEAVC